MNSEIRDEVVSIIHDEYLNDFLEIYGITISIAEKHPEQVNNEIRNALTHLARALSPKIKDPHAELRAAKSHLQRAKRDCLKLSIIHKREQLASSMFRIEMTEGTIPRALKARLGSIQKMRFGLFMKESAGGAIVEELRGLLLEALELGDQLLEDYKDSGKEINFFKRLAYKIGRNLQRAVFYITVTLIGAYITLVVLPEDSSWVINGRAIVVSVAEKIQVPIQSKRIVGESEDITSSQ